MCDLHFAFLSPWSRIRRAIVGRPALQPFGFVAALTLYIWWVEPVASGGERTLGITLLTSLPVFSNLLHGDTARDLGLRFDNLRASLRPVVVVTIIGTLLILVASAALGWEPRLSARAGLNFAGYTLWGLTQQYALQAFVYRRLRESVQSSQRASVVAAILFGAIHLPNPILAPVTAVAGYIWCRLYEGSPNLFTLAASHAWLATMLMTHVPKVHRVMHLGPNYLAGQ
jgi:membrane protease YdiL (CAAX protease family)